MDLKLRESLCQLIAGIIVSDDLVEPEEEAFIDRMLAKFQIEDRATIFPIIDRAEAGAKMRELPPEVQQEAFARLLEAAVADGTVVLEERAYLYAVGEVLGLDDAAVDRRIDAAFSSRG